MRHFLVTNHVPHIQASFASILASVSLESENEVALVSEPEVEVNSRIKVVKRPRGVIMAPDQKSFFFVAVSDEHTIKQFDLNSKRLITKLPSGKDPETFVISPDGKRLYTSNEDDSMVAVVDIEKRRPSRKSRSALSLKEFALVLMVNGS